MRQQRNTYSHTHTIVTQLTLAHITSVLFDIMDKMDPKRSSWSFSASHNGVFVSLFTDINTSAS